MTQQRRFTGHIRTCDDHYLLSLLVQEDIVGHILFLYGQLCFDHGVAPLTDVYHVAIVHHRTDVAVLLCRLGKAEQAVYACQDGGVGLHLLYKRLYGDDEFVEDTCLEREYLLFGTQNLLFVFFQFLGDIALGLHQRLLAHPLLWHAVLIRVSHLEIVAKHVVIANLQRLDACLFGFAVLYLQQVVLTAVGDMSQFVEFLVDAIAHHPTLLHQLWRVVDDLTFYPVAYLAAFVHALAQLTDYLVVGLQTSLFDGFYGLQRPFQLYHLTRCDTSYGHLRDDALQVAHLLQLFVDQVAEVRLAKEIVHDVQSALDGSLLLQGKYQPAAQHASAHGRHGAVYHVEQRATALLHGLYEFQRADGELIQSHVFIFFNARYLRDVAYLCVLCLFQILQNGTSSHHAAVKMIHTKALQRLHLEVLQQLLHGKLLGEDPLVHLERDVAHTEVALEVLTVVAVVEHLLRLYAGHQLLHIVVGAFARQVFAGRDIEESHAAGRLTEMHRTEEVVLLVVQHIVAHSHTGSHQFGDAALHQFLSEFWILQLVADSHALAGTN